MDTVCSGTRFGVRAAAPACLRDCLRVCLRGCLVVWLVVCWMSPSPAYAAGGPEESLALLQQAVTTKDAAMAEKYLDIPTIVANGLETLLKDPAFSAEVGRSPVMALAMALGGNAAGNESLRTLLTAEVREYVRYGVASGAFAGKPDPAAPPFRSLFGKLFRGGEKDRKAFGPVTVTQRDKDRAVVATRLQEGAKGRSYPLQLGLERQDGLWRVVEVLNAKELFHLEGEKR